MRNRMVICPKCNKAYINPPAISRRTGEQICPDCGTDEALEDARRFIAPDASDEDWMDFKKAVIASSLKQGVFVGRM